MQFKDQQKGEPTREQVREKMREVADALPYVGHGEYEERRTLLPESVNKDPVSSNLETFEDLDDAFKMAEDIQNHSIGRASKEQGGGRRAIDPSKDYAPVNE